MVAFLDGPSDIVPDVLICILVVACEDKGSLNEIT